jgi:hypothetical protein
MASVSPIRRHNVKSDKEALKELLASWDELAASWKAIKGIPKRDKEMLAGILIGTALLVYAKPLSEIVEEATEAYKKAVEGIAPPIDRNLMEELKRVDLPAVPRKRRSRKPR